MRTLIVLNLLEGHLMSNNNSSGAEFPKATFIYR
uniref:Uncharacterized protein n=1 Tax=Rhizophora mucronata TaxID=61149 RepID=A0A2P2R5B9_RHIMU